MAKVTIQKDSIGVRLTVVFKDSSGNAIDISDGTTLNILLKPPSDGTLLTKTATFTGTGTDGSVYYDTVSGDLDTAGEWQIQAYKTNGSDAIYTRIGVFTVLANLT